MVNSHTTPEQDIPTTAELERALAIAAKFKWLGTPILLGALVTSFWCLYVVFVAKGFAVALFAFFLLSICYKFGPAPMFAIASSALSFYFNAVGPWLPVASYVAAATSFYVDLRVDRARRAIVAF